jgi:hypothetical protein
MHTPHNTSGNPSKMSRPSLSLRKNALTTYPKITTMFPITKSPVKSPIVISETGTNLCNDGIVNSSTSCTSSLLLHNNPNTALDICDNTDIVPNEYYACYICGEKLLQNEIQINDHLNTCIDRLEKSKSSENNTSKESAVVCMALNSDSYICIICDLDLSNKHILVRCQHIKKCAKLHNIGIKTLLQMITPNKQDAMYEYDNNDDDTVIDISEDIGIDINTITSGNNIVNDSNKLLNSNSSSGNITTNTTTNINHNHNSVVNKPTDMNSILMANAKIKWKRGIDETENGNNGFSVSKQIKSQYNNVSNYVPSFKKVQYVDMPVPIVVDGFDYCNHLNTDCYFLTHFHSDHYSGLSKQFNSGMYI